MSIAPADTLHDKHLRLWGIPLSVTALLISQMPIYFPGRLDLLWKYVVISVLYTGLIWEISRWILIRIRRRYAGLEHTRQRAFRMFLAFTLVVGLGQAFITSVIVGLNLEPPIWVSPAQTWLINFASSLFFVALIGGVYEAKYFFSQYKDALQKAEHLKTRQAQQQLDALKTRVNPHFLFNSLTTLSALIGEDAHRAEQFVDELSKVYRYLLRAGRQPAAALEEELQFAESYTFLLRNRFEEGTFSLNLDAADADLLSPPDYGRHLPTLTLQNALDYLVRTQNAPLHIRLQVQKTQLGITCENRPKALSFDVSDNDWAPLENAGATREVLDENLTIAIPFTSNNTFS